MKNIRIFYLKNCHFLVVKFSVYLNRRVFVMEGPYQTAHLLISSWQAIQQNAVPECTFIITFHGRPTKTHVRLLIYCDVSLQAN